MQVPILRLGEILLTTIQTDLSDDEAEMVQIQLLDSLHKTSARGVILDISALDVVDSFLARVFNDTATMARILGARVVISGMRPAVALTLVEMGRELIDVETSLDLEQGLDMLRETLRREDLETGGE